MSSRDYLYKNLRPELVAPDAPAQADASALQRSSEPRFTLERDVVLSTSNRQQLDEALVKIRYHDVIYETWGFAQVDPNGRGTLLNFHGAPGTGKTLTAEAFAGSIG